MVAFHRAPGADLVSKQPRIDPLPHLRAVAEAVRVPDQARATFEALDRAFAAVLGHKLFTVLRYHEDTGERKIRDGIRRRDVPPVWARRLWLRSDCRRAGISSSSPLGGSSSVPLASALKEAVPGISRVVLSQRGTAASAA